MKRAREKEASRAKETAENFADREDFEKKYESLKENHPTQFATAMDKRQLAAKAWRTAAEGISSASSYEQISVLKMPAYDAEGAAELARLELKATGAEQEWKRSAEKSDSREVAATAEQLIQNQKAIIQATRQNLISQRTLRQLEIDRTNLEKKMREAYENSRKERQPEKDKKPSHDREKKHSHNDEKPERPERPNQSNVE